MSDSLIGSQLGDYEVKHCIGKGGMGTVYLARQISLDRPVALKVLPPELCTDQEYVDRFLREARAAAHLNHPNVIQIYDAGVADNLYFIVMEYVDGKNLGQILKEQTRFEERDALYIVQQTAEGLGFAHKMSVVHRDVKPENIMVTYQRRVKIGDLGLAKWKPNDFDASLTMSGTTMGTPYYISPEQIRGMKDIDGRADIYSLGMTLYHLLSGKPAFLGNSGAAIMAQHLSDKLPPLQVANPSVSQETIELIEAMTIKKRDYRLQEMSEVSEWISEIIGIRPRTNRVKKMRKTSTLMWKAEENWHQIWRWGMNLLTGATVILVLVIALILFWKKSHPEASPTSPTAATPAPAGFHALPANKTPSGNSAKAPATPSSHNPAPSESVVVEPVLGGDVSSGEASAVDIRQFEGTPFPFLQAITISSTDDAPPQNVLTVGRSPDGAESKILIRPNLIGNDPEDLALLAKKLKTCRSGTLELTPLAVSPDTDLEIQIYPLLHAWGCKVLPPDQANGPYLIAPDETNWNWASARKKLAWWNKGASVPRSDYETLPLGNPENAAETTFHFTSESGDHPLRINILPDLRGWAEKSKKEFVPHWGWVICAVKGHGEVRFAALGESGSPRLVFQTSPPDSADRQISKNDTP